MRNRLFLLSVTTLLMVSATVGRAQDVDMTAGSQNYSEDGSSYGQNDGDGDGQATWPAASETGDMSTTNQDPIDPAVGAQDDTTAAAPADATPADVSSIGQDAVVANDDSAAPAASSDQDDQADAATTAGGIGILVCFLVLICLGLYFAPTIIAMIRGHAYVWVILAINLFGGWTGLGWCAALAWAVWPKEKAMTDPILGNVTGLGTRNHGDVMGAVDHGRVRGRRAEEGVGDGDDLDYLERLAKMKELGIINEQEFKAHKSRILARH